MRKTQSSKIYVKSVNIYTGGFGWRLRTNRCILTFMLGCLQGSCACNLLNGAMWLLVLVNLGSIISYYNARMTATVALAL